MSAATNPTGAATWLADVIHVNEDGWVLINRGQRAGVLPGLRLLVVGTGIRELRNLFAGASDGAGDPPVALRIRRTYEQLEVVYAEADCAVAVATRAPHERRPSFYRGPEGELLVWVPMLEGYTYPQPGVDAEPEDNEDDQSGVDVGVDAHDDSAPLDETESASDAPPETADQEDQRWEEALPLNGASVGDLVVPATPVSAAAGDASAQSVLSAAGTAGGTAAQPEAAPGAEGQANPFEAGQTYDWLKPN